MKLNNYSTPYKLESQDCSYTVFLTDIDSIYINIVLEDLKERPRGLSYVFLKDITLDILGGKAWYNRMPNDILNL